MTSKARWRNAIPYIALFLVFALTTRLGFWQLDRAELRDALSEQMNALKSQPPLVLGLESVDASKLAFHPLQAEGEWRPEHLVLLDNQQHHGRVGFHVFMPLRLKGTDTHVLVNRGWVGGNLDRESLPKINTPPGAQQVLGFARAAPPTFSRIAGTSQVKSIWSEVSLKSYAEWSGLRLQSVILYQTSDGKDQLIRDWDSPTMGADRNRGYAIQWFGLAAMAAIFGGILFMRRLGQGTNE